MIVTARLLLLLILLMMPMTMAHTTGIERRQTERSVTKSNAREAESDAAVAAVLKHRCTEETIHRCENIGRFRPYSPHFVFSQRTKIADI